MEKRRRVHEVSVCLNMKKRVKERVEWERWSWQKRRDCRDRKRAGEKKKTYRKTN